jgi:predicted component of type VI protein secretion system
MLAQLIPNDGGPPITLHNAITVIGRSARLCDLVINQTNISKQHCMLVKTDGLIYMRDLGSTNGTRVNGQRVVRGALLPGDMLSFSSVSYRVHLGPDGVAPGKVNLAGATEWIPRVDDHGLNAGDSDADGQQTIRRKKTGDSSHSDVRLLRDSDLLLPD